MSTEQRTPPDLTENRPIVALLDSTGEIVWVNRSWTDFGDENGITESYRSLGRNYLEITRRADTDSAGRVAEGLAAVLDGTRAEFTTVYPCHAPDRKRWFRLYAAATPVGDGTGCLLVHRNATDRVSEDAAADPPFEVIDRSTVLSSGAGRLVTYTPGADETILDAVVAAYEAIPDFDIYEQESVLNDWVDIGTLERFLENAADARAFVRVWGYPVGVSPEEVVVYDVSDRATPPSDG